MKETKAQWKVSSARSSQLIPVQIFRRVSSTSSDFGSIFGSVIYRSPNRPDGDSQAFATENVLSRGEIPCPSTGLLRELRVLGG